MMEKIWDALNELDIALEEAHEAPFYTTESAMLVTLALGRVNLEITNWRKANQDGTPASEVG